MRLLAEPLLLLMLMLNLWPVGVRAAVWYVSPTGNDTNPGTEEAPFRTTSRAVQAAQPGDEVVFSAGEYAQLSTLRSGTPEAPIRFRAREVNGIPDPVLLGGFSVITPGANGYGEWTLHAGAIWKISVPSGVGFGVGANLLFLAGEALRPARWPDAIAPVDFDRQRMAEAVSGTIDLNSKGTQPPYSQTTFYTGTYQDPALANFEPNAWAGAHIDLCAGHNWWHKTGVVTGNDGQTITFRYLFAETWDPVLDTPKVGDRYALWGHLRALDSPGEFFFDVNGINGPPRTLYVWLPDSQSPVGADLRLLSRARALEINAHTDLHFENLTLVGGVWTSPDSARIRFRGIQSRYGGFNRNLLQSVSRVAIELRGASHVFEDGVVSDTWGRAITPFGAGHRVENNVAWNAAAHLLSLASARDTVVRRNSVWAAGDTAVDIGGKALLLEWNHVSHSGMRITDVAVMNTWNAGDLEGTEIRYNWVHDNQAPRNDARSWWGGQGIRLDSGSAPNGVYNVLIHHNQVWATTSDSSISMWRLPVTSPGYGNANIRVYQNTVDRGLVLAGEGSDGGIRFQRNLAALWSSPSGPVVDSVVSENLFRDTTVTGNLRADPGFVSPMNRNFSLRSDSPARDYGTPIAGVTQQPGPAYLGALPPDTKPWRPGALLRARDLPSLRVEVRQDALGVSRLWVTGAPAGRGFADSFRVRVGDRIFANPTVRTDTQTRRAEAWLAFDATGLPTQNALALDLGDGVWREIPGQLQVTVVSPALVPEPSPGIPAAGGSEVRVPATGLFGDRGWLTPVAFSSLRLGDLLNRPVPWLVDTASWVASGMAPDASDLRIFAADGVTPVSFHIERGLGTTSTLIWLYIGSAGDQNQISDEDLSGIFLSWGVPFRSSADDPSVLLAATPLLGSSDLLLHLRATDLDLPEGSAVEAWPDRSPQNFPVLQGTASARPVFRANAMGGLPAVSFDGVEDHLLVNGAAGLGVGPSRAFTVYRNPNPGTVKYQRLFSARANTTELDYMTGTYGTPPTDAEGTVQASTTPVIAQHARTGNFSRENFRIGSYALSGASPYRGEIAEFILFNRELTTEERSAISAHLRRKYDLDPRPQGTPDWAGRIEPLRVWVDGVLATGARIDPDGALRFVAPPYAGSGPLPRAVDLRVRLPDGRELLATGAFTYLPHPATVMLSGLTHTYNGQPKTATATTVPPGLAVKFVYDGTPSAPVDAGNHTVLAEVEDPLYAGSATDTLVIQPATLRVSVFSQGKTAGQPDPAPRWAIVEGQLYGADALSGTVQRDGGDLPGSYTLGRGSLDAGANYNLIVDTAPFHIHIPGGSTEVQDSLTDGGSSDGTDPLDVRWRSSDADFSLISIAEDAVLDPTSPYRVLDFNISKTTDPAGKDDYLYFALPRPVVLAVGQTLRVRYRLRIQGGPPRADASRTGVSIGYRSTGTSPWIHPDNAEYFATTSYGAAGTLGTLRKSAAQQFLNVGTTLRSGVRSVNLGNAPGQVEFSVTRVDETTARLRFQLDGHPADEVLDTAATHWHFNWVFLRFRKASQYSTETFRVDDMRVEVLNEGHRPRLESIDTAVRFPTSAAYRYRLEEATYLEDGGDWQPISASMNGDGNELQFPIPASDLSRRFLRIGVQSVPAAP